MRGTHGSKVTLWAALGLIPTYAGNTDIRLGLDIADGAHPHVCGEHTPQLISTPLDSGSSPRMRGTQGRDEVVAERHGLIPTYAGNTTRSPSAAHQSWAHPHVCGEHSLARVRDSRVRGSSPRMRGTHLTILPCSCVRGLIPTYAGNTDAVGGPFSGGRAHPHVCGEHSGSARCR